MAREDSPYIYGDFWLDKRRDGRAPNVWQIAWYEAGTRQIRNRSTRKRDVDEAASVLRAYEQEQAAKGQQRPEDALVIPLLFLYWKERGSKADSAGQIASSLRQFIGFLMQDAEATTDLTVAGISNGLWTRFREWRMAPHEYDVPWMGKDYRHSSPGVSGEAVSRNLDDVRAALNHQVDNNRLPYVPKVPGVPEGMRSPARDKLLSTKELGAIIGYASYNIGALRWVLAMIATAARPDALLALDPKAQQVEDFALLDIQPRDWPRTKKHNPVIPVIPEFEPWLRAWAANPHPPVLSRKTWWRHMRRELGLSDDVVPKTIRHSIATMLRKKRVPKEEVETLLGHLVLKRTSRVYAKYDPEYLQAVKAPLSTIWAECCAAAHEWLAVHLLSTPMRGQKLTVVKKVSNLRH